MVNAPPWLPPVANTFTPAKDAIYIVAATVVAPSNLLATTTGMSLLLTFITFLPSFATYSISSRDKPTHSTPLIIAIVAGTAPPSLIISPHCFIW